MIVLAGMVLDKIVLDGKSNPPVYSRPPFYLFQANVQTPPFIPDPPYIPDLRVRADECSITTSSSIRDTYPYSCWAFLGTLDCWGGVKLPPV